MPGFLGIGIGLFVYITILCNIKSFGVPYLAPYSPVTKMTGNGYFVSPTWKQERRPDYLNTKKLQSQKPISMNWKYHSTKYGG